VAWLSLSDWKREVNGRWGFALTYPASLIAEPAPSDGAGRSRELGTDELSRKDAWSMLKRRLRDAGLSTIYSNQSFRGAGITNYLENAGTLEVAQRIAGHADSRTTKLYDRRGQKVLLEDMERIRY
jgi:integrase